MGWHPIALACERCHEISSDIPALHSRTFLGRLLPLYKAFRSGVRIGSNPVHRNGFLPPMIQTINIFILFHAPLLWYVCHPKLLSLIYEWSSCLTSHEYGQHFCTLLPVHRARTCKSIDRPWLVMILEIKRIPATIGVHKNLPFCDNAFQLAQLPFSWGEFTVRAVIDVDTIQIVSFGNKCFKRSSLQLKMKDHI